MEKISKQEILYTSIGSDLNHLAYNFTKWVENSSFLDKIIYHYKRKFFMFKQSLKSGVWYAIAEEVVDILQRKYSTECEIYILKLLSKITKNKEKILGKIGPTSFKECWLYVYICYHICMKVKQGSEHHRELG